MDVPGLDTIKTLTGEPPVEIPIPHKLMKTQQISMQGWNACYIAIIPYCFKCKHPLVWHTPPDGDELFTCPNCGRVWVKGEGWNDKTKKVSNTTG